MGSLHTHDTITLGYKTLVPIFLAETELVLIIVGVLIIMGC